MGERVFLLPDPGEGLTEAEVVTWLVAEGDAVTLNQPIAEVETAKAVVEIPSPYAGVVVRLHAPAGNAVAVGEPLVTFEVADGGAASTPAVRRLAREAGVEIGAIAGTGPGGRVTAEDVQGAAAAGDGSASPAEAGADTDTEVREVTGTRRAIADRLTRAAAVPQVTTFRTLDCGALEELRTELGLSPLPIVLAALARVVAEHPLLNASWGGDGRQVLLHRTVNVGIAVDTEHGLVVPVVRNVAVLGLAAIAEEIRRLADAARGGGLGPDDVSGATIAVSNTGSYGSEAGTPLLNPGNAVTMAVGVIEPRALVVDGLVVARPACTLSLTFDHQVLDGAEAGRALTDLVALLQDPERLRDLPR
ncbi:MAG: dihydrolipoamide acetyltransferase family protein [Actinomycetota bacterium]